MSTPPPAEPHTVEGLLRVIEVRDGELAVLRLMVDKLKLQLLRRVRAQFNTSSEQLQASLIEEQALPVATCKPNGAKTEAANASTIDRSLPAHLPREAQVHRPETSAAHHDAAGQPCGCTACGGRLRQIGQDVSEQLEYVPAHFKVIRHVRPKLACVRCQSIFQADAAIRITRAFLTHCARKNWIDWEPRDQHIDRPEAARDDLATTLPGAVREIVLGKVKASSEREARRNFVTALSFWGGLKPRELAGLEVRHQRRNGEQLKCPDREHDVELPAAVCELWNQYREHRARYSEVTRSSPLISGLRSHTAVSAWAIWSILKGSGSASDLSTRQLRAGYMTASTIDAERDIGLAQRQIGKPAPSLSPIAPKCTSALMRQLNQRALEQIEAQNSMRSSSL